MKKKTKIILGLGLAVILLFVVFKNHKNTPQYDTTVVGKKDIMQEVSVTGKVKPAQALDLAFEQSGKITKVNVRVGDHVKKDSILANLSSADTSASLLRSSAGISSARADLAHYEAALENEKIQLEELKNGTRSEELQISEANLQQAKTAFDDAKDNLDIVVSKAETDLENIYNNVPDTLQSSYNTVNTAFFEEIASLFLRDTDFDRLSFITKDSNQRFEIERNRIALKSVMAEFNRDIANIPTDQAGRDRALIKAKEDVLQIRSFFSALSLAVDTNADLSVTTENTYRGYVNTGRASINSALASLVAQEQSISSQKANNSKSIQAAQSALNSAQKGVDVSSHELDLKRAGARPEQIAAEESRVKQAEANVLSARARVSQAVADYQSVVANFNKTVLRAPIDGIITKVDAKVGQFIASNSSAMALISEADYEIEANVPEVDISKITLGKQADVTLDAYGDDVIFKSEVTKIDPAETMVEGVATYKITLQFLQKDERIKSGMTANLDILIDTRQSVLAVPARAVLIVDGKKTVKVLKDPQKSPENKDVETGLRGSDGNLEILKGLNEGDVIILSEITA